MARVNRCKVCSSTDPEHGWAGTNHNRAVTGVSRFSKLTSETRKCRPFRYTEKVDVARSTPGSQDGCVIRRTIVELSLGPDTGWFSEECSCFLLPLNTESVATKLRNLRRYPTD